MRTLILMRHAKSDWSVPGLADHDRPLNKRGKRAAPLMAQKLAIEGLHADVVLASSARRVQDTVKLLRESWSTEAAVLTERSLYLASEQEIARQIEALHDSWQTALVVGHNPGIVSLCCRLAGSDLEMPTAAIAVFRSPADTWQNCISHADISPGGSSRHWQLVEHWKPRDLE